MPCRGFLKADVPLSRTPCHNAPFSNRPTFSQTPNPRLISHQRVIKGGKVTSEALSQADQGEILRRRTP